MENGTISLKPNEIVILSDLFGISCDELLKSSHDFSDSIDSLKNSISLEFDTARYDDDKEEEFLILKIRKALLKYLYNDIDIRTHHPTLDDESLHVINSHYKSDYINNKSDEMVAFVPMPAGEIDKGNNPNSWHQQELLTKITYYFNNNIRKDGES